MRDSETSGTSAADGGVWVFCLHDLAVDLLGIHGAGPNTIGLQAAGQKHIATGDAVAIFMLSFHDTTLLLCHPWLFSVLHFPPPELGGGANFIRLISTCRRVALRPGGILHKILQFLDLRELRRDSHRRAQSLWLATVPPRSIGEVQRYRPGDHMQAVDRC